MAGTCCWQWWWSTLIAFKELLDRHVDVPRMEGYRFNAGRQELVLALCSTQTLWTKGPVPMLHYSLFKVPNLPIILLTVFIVLKACAIEAIQQNLANYSPNLHKLMHYLPTLGSCVYV